MFVGAKVTTIAATLRFAVKQITFATGPVHLDDEGPELRKRLGERLETALDLPVLVVATRSYSELAAFVNESSAHVAWMPPAIFARLEAAKGMKLCAAVDRARGAGYRGVLFVQRDSKTETAADLEAERVAWVDRSSCAGHLFVKLGLRQEGIDPDAVFSEQRFLGSHGSVVRAVMNGDCDVGATHAQLDPAGEIVLAGWQAYAGKLGMRPLLISPPIPPDVIAVSNQLDDTIATKIRRAMLGLHEDGGSELLDEFFGGTRLVNADSEDYDSVREAIAGA